MVIWFYGRMRISLEDGLGVDEDGNRWDQVRGLEGESVQEETTGNGGYFGTR